jgi:hypothetical protein
MEGKNYPFISPSADLDYVVADFYMSVEYSNLLRQPFRISRIHGLDSYLSINSSLSSEALTVDTQSITADNDHVTVDQTALLEWVAESSFDFNPLDIFVVDSNDTIVFASVLADYYQSYAYGPNKRLHEWVFRGVGFARLIQYTAWPDDVTPPVLPTDLYPESSILNPHSYDILPARLKVVQVDDEYYDGDIVLKNGFNTELYVGEQLSFPQRRSRIAIPTVPSAPDTSRVDGGLNETVVTMAAAPGSGLGKYPGCEDEPSVIYRINGVGPDEYGNFTFSAGDPSTESGACTYIRRTGAIDGSDFVAEPASLDLGDDCSVCCNCQSYANTYKAIRHNFLIIKNLVRRYHVVRDRILQYNDALTSRVECDQENPLRLSAQVSANFLDIIAAYVNLSDECVYDVTLNLEFKVREMDGHWPLDRCNEAQLVRCTAYAIGGQYKDWSPVTLDGEFPDLSFNFEYVKPYDAAGIQFRLEFPCRDTHRVQTCLTATDSRGDIPNDENPAEICRQDLVPGEDCYPEESSISVSSESIGGH